MTPPLAASGLVTLIVAFGVGGIAIALLLGGLLAMLERHDRRALLRLLRHPLRTAMGLEERDRRG